MVNRCFLGDCRDVMRSEAFAAALTVKPQTCITSPPYWGLRDYGVDGQMGSEESLEEYIAGMVEVFDLVRDHLADDGTLWLNLGDSYAGAPGGGQGQTGQRRSRTFTAKTDFKKTGAGLKPKDLVGVPWRVAFALQAAGWYLRQDIIWAKPNPMPESAKDRCTKAHEYIFLLSKSPRYFFDQAAISEPASKKTNPRRANNGHYVPGGWAQGGNHSAADWNTPERRTPGNKSHKGTAAYEAGAEEHRTKAGLLEYSRKMEAAGSGVKNNESFDAAMNVMPDRRNKRSVWTVGSDPYAEAHFATFPPKLIEPCVLAGSRPGDLVFDPFLGSGTTAEVAQRLGRKWVGIELNPEYVKMQDARTAQQGLIL